MAPATGSRQALIHLKYERISFAIFVHFISSPILIRLTTESAEHLQLKLGDDIELVIKAIHVLPVKD